jgi:hypothetical protein
MHTITATDQVLAEHAADDRLEAIAKDIESLQASAIMRNAERLAEAREIFRYRRDEGGFAGWVESRLRRSRQTAYNLLQVHERFGGQECPKGLDTLARSVLFLVSSPSCPPEARDQIIEQAKAGEPVSVAEAKEVIGTAKGKQPAKKPRGWSREQHKAHRARKRGHPVKEVVEPDPVEQPENNDLAILSNPIARAWCKATNAQRKEFALEYKNHIEAFVDEEQRRLPYAEQRRLHRPANDLDTKIETKIETEENATNGGAAEAAPPAEPAQPDPDHPDLTDPDLTDPDLTDLAAKPWPTLSACNDPGDFPQFLRRDQNNRVPG